MIVGVAAGLFTGALWALTFVVPKVVAPFTAVDLAVVRYGLFGILSVLLMLHPRFRPRAVSFGIGALGIGLGAVSYVGYFLVIAAAVHFAGPAIPPLVVGAMPVVIGLIGNRGRDRVPFTRLAVPLLLVGGGLLIVNLETFFSGTVVQGSGLRFAAGLGFSFLALAMWSGYAVINAAVLKMAGAPSTLSWAGLQGIGALVGVMPLVALTSWMVLPAADLPGGGWWSPEAARFTAVAVFMAVAATWLATWTWIVAAQRLPLVLSSQLIVAETLFGLMFGFAWDGRWPTVPEGTGAAIQVVGVAAAIVVFARKAATERRSAFDANADRQVQPSANL